MAATESGLSILVDPFEGGSATVFRETAQDAVFDHAKELATLAGFSLDSDEFTAMYRNLMERYDEALEYSHYLTQVAFVAVKAMMETGAVSLTTTVKETGIEESLQKSIRTAALALCAALTHVAAGRDHLWVPNEVFENVPSHLRSIPFDFHLRRLEDDEEATDA